MPAYNFAKRVSTALTITIGLRRFFQIINPMLTVLHPSGAYLSVSTTVVADRTED